jgi:Protein of unknown function (DUF2997)
MQYYKIEFTINKDGSVTERVIATGSNCTAVTEQLEKAMGFVRDQELLPEYQETTQTEDEILWTSQ